jgi:hypothetical protein
VGSEEQQHANAIPPPPIPKPQTRLDWRIAFPRVIGAAFIGTILLMVFSLLLPPILVVLLIIPFTGAISVWLYKTRDAELTAGKGFRLGFVTGFFLFFINLIAPLVTYLTRRDQFMAVLKQQFDLAAQNADPRSQEMLRNLSQHPETIATLAVVGAVFGLVMFTVASGIGGAIAGRARHP